MSTEAPVEEAELSEGPVELFETPEQGESAATGNFIFIALYQIVLRTGWIFKTESIVMPAVLDSLGGPGWLRGCLPMLNRFGQSVPPVLASGRIHSSRRKKLVLASSTMLMGLIFLGLAAIWWTVGGSGELRPKPSWLPYAFLALYGLFFMCTGINQLGMGTLTGKLIPVASRGRLMLFASTIGTASAVICALVLLPRWLTAESGNFLAIFALTGGLFLLAALIVLLLDEEPDNFPRTKSNASSLFRSAAQALADDPNLRRLAVLGALFGMSLTLFPHYQALGRQRLSLGLDALVPWVITQNLGVAFFSVPSGWLADRVGNRLVLRLLLAVICLVPPVALAVSRWGEGVGVSFTLVFFMIGATPVMIRTLTNYCLELAPRELQPRYLSTLSLCTAGPAIFTAPLIGGLVDWVGFEPVFLLVESCVIVAFLVTFSILEPRSEASSTAARKRI